MIDSLIATEVSKAQSLVKSNQRIDISCDRAFSYVVIQHFFYRGDDSFINDIHGKITDGANDGGIDFVYLDEDAPCVILGQSKFTESLGYDDVVNELVKMTSTVQSFHQFHTGSFNSNVQRELQNALDALPDEHQGDVEYYLFTTATINETEVRHKIANRLPDFPLETFNLIQANDIVSKISLNMEEIAVVAEDKITIDKAGNVLEYEESKLGRKGAMVNMSSDSLIALYNKYIDHGLLALNIRGFVANKKVDSGIDKTLQKERENFWFYNNGITIACDDFSISGDVVRLYNFSIVNGGQTTNRIGNYKGSNTERFFIPCKIIAHGENEESSRFFSTIAEASNAQKPIQPRDLRANSPEMKRLHSWLNARDIFLEVKRGSKKPRNKKVIKNDELAQAMLSFVHQQPGTARSGKRSIFEKEDTYSKIFKKNYENDANKQDFIVDLIDLVLRFNAVDKHLKSADGSLSNEDKEALKNGRQAIFGMMGMLYCIVNQDITRENLQQDLNASLNNDFVYGAFLSNYKGDDINDLLTQLVALLAHKVAQSYSASQYAKKSTSISNFLKTDKKYREEALKDFVYNLQFDDGQRILQIADLLFSRSE